MVMQVLVVIGNYLGCFNTPVTPQQHITLLMNNSVSGNIGSSTVAIPQSISSVSDANNRAVSVNSISHKSSSVSSLPSGSGSDGNSNNDLVDKSKDDITDEIALKVSNPAVKSVNFSRMQFHTFKALSIKESSNNDVQGNDEKLFESVPAQTSVECCGDQKEPKPDASEISHDLSTVR